MTKKFTPPILLSVAFISLVDAFGAQAVSPETHMALAAQFNAKYQTAQAQKVSHRLLKTLMSDDSANTYKVDLFVSSAVDSPNYTKHDSILHGNASYTFDLKNGRSDYTLNNKPATHEEIEQYMSEQESIFADKRAMHAKERSQNIQKIAALLGKSQALSKAADAATEYLSLTLTKAELVTLLQKADDAISDYDVHSELTPSSYSLSDWENTRNGYLQGVSLTQMHTSWNNQFPNTRGEGIGIYYSDAMCPTSKTDLYAGYTATAGNYQEVGNYDTQDAGAAYHTRIITGIFGTVANNINMYCNDDSLSTGTEFFTSILPDSVAPDRRSSIHVESYSINSLPADAHYQGIDRVFDNHTYLNRTIPVFISASNISNDNPLGHVLSPAKAFNVISVGSYKRNGSGNQEWSLFSGYQNPLTPIYNNIIQKPEISAPGEGFYIDPCLGVTGRPCSELTKYDSGTSYATPWAAAMAADAMSRGSYWRSSAAMIKALMIAGASDPVSGGRDKVGEGGADLYTMIAQNTNSAFWYDTDAARPFRGTNPSRFDYDDNCFTDWQTWLIGGRKQRIVISWLNNISTASTLSNIPNSYKLELLNASGQVVRSAWQDTQGYQIIDDAAQPSGLYTLRICKMCQDTAQRFDIGMAVSQREESSSWLQ